MMVKNVSENTREELEIMRVGLLKKETTAGTFLNISTFTTGLKCGVGSHMLGSHLALTG